MHSSAVGNNVTVESIAYVLGKGNLERNPSSTPDTLTLRLT